MACRNKYALYVCALGYLRYGITNTTISQSNETSQTRPLTQVLRLFLQGPTKPSKGKQNVRKAPARLAPPNVSSATYVYILHIIYTLDVSDAFTRILRGLLLSSPLLPDAMYTGGLFCFFFFLTDVGCAFGSLATI